MLVARVRCAGGAAAINDAFALPVRLHWWSTTRAAMHATVIYGGATLRLLEWVPQISAVSATRRGYAFRRRSFRLFCRRSAQVAVLLT